MQIKRIIDLSQPFTEEGYQNPAFADGRIETCMRHETEGWYAETIIAATHTGTHVDAALHKIKGGKSIDKYPLERFIGNAVIIDLYHKAPDAEITREDIYVYDSLICPGMNVLLCTGWSEKRRPETKDMYLYHSPWLGKAAAEYLVEKKINAVGIDHFSIGGANSNHVEIPHDILLGAEVLIFEGLRLPKVLFEKKIWFIVAFPIIAQNAGGALVRFVAIE